MSDKNLPNSSHSRGTFTAHHQIIYFVEQSDIENYGDEVFFAHIIISLVLFHTTTPSYLRFSTTKNGILFSSAIQF